MDRALGQDHKFVFLGACNRANTDRHAHTPSQRSKQGNERNDFFLNNPLILIFLIVFPYFVILVSTSSSSPPVPQNNSKKKMKVAQEKALRHKFCNHFNLFYFLPIPVLGFSCSHLMTNGDLNCLAAPTYTSLVLSKFFPFPLRMSYLTHFDSWSQYRAQRRIVRIMCVRVAFFHPLCVPSVYLRKKYTNFN